MTHRIIVTGAGGFLGRASVAALVAAGHDVTAIYSRPTAAPAGALPIIADVAEGLPAATLEGADVLVHLAWRNDPGRGNNDMRQDVLGNLAAAVGLFEQAARAGVRRIIYASSGGTVYGKAEVPTSEATAMAPIGGYGAGKGAAELYLRAIGAAHGINTTVLRIANAYGPGQYPNRGQGFIATAIARALSNQPIEIFGSAEMRRDYVFIGDIAAAITLACSRGTGSTVCNIGSGTAHSLTEVVAQIFATLGQETEVRNVSGRSMDVPVMQLDISRAASVLGWRPTTGLGEGIAASAEWIRTLPELAG